MLFKIFFVEILENFHLILFKDSRLTLMDEIRQFKFSAANDDEDTEKVAAAENWIVKASDSVTVVLTQKEVRKIV